MIIKNKRTFSYNFPAEEIRQELKKSQPLVNIIVSENSPIEEKMKYSVSQSLLTYQQESKKSFATLVKEIEISSLTEKKLIDICRGKLTNFSLGELVIYANNLRITFIPCYNCGVNLYPSLLGEILASFKNQVNFYPQKVYQEHAHLSV
jgi:hypothetical protein